MPKTGRRPEFYGDVRLIFGGAFRTGESAEEIYCTVLECVIREMSNLVDTVGRSFDMPEGCHPHREHDRDWVVVDDDGVDDDGIDDDGVDNGEDVNDV